MKLEERKRLDGVGRDEDGKIRDMEVSEVREGEQ